MSTRTRQRTRTQEEFYDEFEDSFDLDTLSDEELEELLFEEDTRKSKSPFNLPTMAGLSMIVVGIAYQLQQLGMLGGLNLGALVSMLPWLAGILIILLGFGVLSWRPKKKKRKLSRREAKEASSNTATAEAPPKTKTKTKYKDKDQDKKRLRKSRNKKIAGVCGGIAEYFNLDPTLVRIAFVIGTIITNGAFLLGYLLLSFIMSPPEPRPAAKPQKPFSDGERRITITPD
jgi:phage shock protein C